VPSVNVKQAYSHFFPLGSLSEPPQLLIDTLSSAAGFFERIVIVSTEQLLAKLQALIPNLVCIDITSLKPPAFSKRYIDLVEEKIIRSNHPPTELLCLERWHYMNECYGEGFLCRGYPCTVLDWDTFLLQPLCEAIDHHLGSPMPLQSITGFIELGVDICKQQDSFPLYDVCPSLMILANEHVQVFCNILERVLARDNDLQRIYKSRLFNDMSIWSCVVSECITKRHHKIIDLDRYPLTSGIFFDHNIRIGWQRNLTKFEMEEFHIDERFRCSKNQMLQIKKMNFTGGGIEVSADGKFYKLGCIHFSGVEAKYVYHTFFRNRLMGDRPYRY